MRQPLGAKYLPVCRSRTHPCTGAPSVKVQDRLVFKRAVRIPDEMVPTTWQSADFSLICQPAEAVQVEPAGCIYIVLALSARQRSAFISITLDQFFFSYWVCLAPQNLVAFAGRWSCWTHCTAYRLSRSAQSLAMSSRQRQSQSIKIAQPA